LLDGKHRLSFEESTIKAIHCSRLDMDWYCIRLARLLGRDLP
jgi:hypothetical protein